MKSSWQSGFINLPPFAPLFPFSQQFSQCSDWPQIELYNQLAITKKLISKSELPITFIEQQTKSRNFIDQYEPRIYLTGEVQTRKNNWHDFFNTLVWLTFPKTKATLNELQYLALKKRLHESKSRTTLENIMTLFDENGALVLSSNQELLELLKNFQWKDLFWNQRAAAISQMQFIIFGHSLYEKALNPYIGMTASSLIFLVEEKFFKKNAVAKMDIIDGLLADCFANNAIKSTQMLVPLPILGIPGWNEANNNSDYYDNVSYFRPKKSI